VRGQWYLFKVGEDLEGRKRAQREVGTATYIHQSSISLVATWMEAFRCTREGGRESYNRFQNKNETNKATPPRVKAITGAKREKAAHERRLEVVVFPFSPTLLPVDR